MSVLIKGMDMPKCCRDCILTYIDTEDDANFGLYEYRCIIDDSSISILSSERAYDCPLVEVPTQHGRLIEENIVRDIIDDTKHNPEAHAYTLEIITERLNHDYDFGAVIEPEE